MRMLLTAGVCGALLLLPGPAGTADKEKAAEVKERLQELNDYIGGWKGNGFSETNKDEFWKEIVNWSWRIKGDDYSLVLEITKGKNYKSGELRFLPDKK